MSHLPALKLTKENIENPDLKLEVNEDEWAEHVIRADMTDRELKIKDANDGRFLAMSDIYTCAGFGFWDEPQRKGGMTHAGGYEYNGEEIHPRTEELIEYLEDGKEHKLDLKMILGHQTPKSVFKSIRNGLREAAESSYIYKIDLWYMDEGYPTITENVREHELLEPRNEGNLAIDLYTGTFGNYITKPSNNGLSPI